MSRQSGLFYFQVKNRSELAKRKNIFRI